MLPLLMALALCAFCLLLGARRRKRKEEEEEEVVSPSERLKGARLAFLQRGIGGIGAGSSNSNESRGRGRRGSREGTGWTENPLYPRDSHPATLSSPGRRARGVDGGRHLMGRGKYGSLSPPLTSKQQYEPSSPAPPTPTFSVSNPLHAASFLLRRKTEKFFVSVQAASSATQWSQWDGLAKTGAGGATPVAPTPGVTSPRSPQSGGGSRRGGARSSPRTPKRGGVTPRDEENPGTPS